MLPFPGGIIEVDLSLYFTGELDQLEIGSVSFPCLFKTKDTFVAKFA